jgi:hypothetical protein
MDRLITQPCRVVVQFVLLSERHDLSAKLRVLYGALTPRFYINNVKFQMIEDRGNEGRTCKAGMLQNAARRIEPIFWIRE